jgi:hypothetical protein
MRQLPRYAQRLLPLILGIALVGVQAVAAQEASPVASPAATQTVRSIELIDGSCDALGQNVTLLADVTIPDHVAAETPVGFSVTSVDQSISRLTSTPLVIVAFDRSSGSDVQVACGAVAGQPVGVDLFIGLPSGSPALESGIAWLHDNGNDTTTITVFLSRELLGSAQPAGTPEAQP